VVPRLHGVAPPDLGADWEGGVAGGRRGVPHAPHPGRHCLVRGPRSRGIRRMQDGGGEDVIPAIRRSCANPACSCEPWDDGCSPWCRAVDRPAGESCRCGHDECVPVPGRGVESAWPGEPGWPDRTRTARAGEPRWLVVVRRDRPGLHPAVRTRSGEPLCLVVVDRRRADRRRGGPPVGTATDRRRGERRQALTTREAEQWLRAGCRLVYRRSVRGSRPGG
jgi:hypothetical protein